MLRWISLVFGLFLALEAPAQSLEDLAKAEQLYIEADKHYALQEYKEAMEKLKEAFRLSDEPALLFTIGQCQFALEQYKEAEVTYKTFLRRVPATDPKRPMAEEKIADAQAALSKIKPTPIEPSTSPATTPTSIASTAPSTEEPTETPTKSKAPLLYGVAAASGVAGVVTGALAFSLKNDVAALTDRDDSQALRVTIENKIRLAGQMATSSVILFGAAAAAGVVGVVLSKQEKATVSVLPGSVIVGIKF